MRALYENRGSRVHFREYENYRSRILAADDKFIADPIRLAADDSHSLGPAHDCAREYKARHVRCNFWWGGDRDLCRLDLLLGWGWRAKRLNASQRLSWLHPLINIDRRCQILPGISSRTNRGGSGYGGG